MNGFGKSNEEIKGQKKNYTARLSAWSLQLEIILQSEFSLAGFQLANHVQNFAAERRRDSSFFRLANDVPKCKIHLGLEAILNLPQRPFTVIGLPRCGE
jgi:hypothetical protein